MRIRAHYQSARLTPIAIVLSICAACSLYGDEAGTLMSAPGVKAGIDFTLPEESFWAPDDDVVNVAREELIKALDELHEQLGEIPTGVSIASDLGLLELAQNLVPSAGDVAVLETILRRAQRTRELPGTPSLKPLRDRLSRYVILMRIRSLPEGQATYRQQISQLTAALNHFAEIESTDAHEKIAAGYGWLALHGQAPQARNLIAERFAKPNLRLEAGEELLLLAETMKIDRELDINQTFQGIRTTGTGAAKGTVDIRYVPNNDAAQLRVTFDGAADCSVKSQRRRVFVWGKMKAKVSGQQDFLVSSSIESREDIEMDVSCNYCPRSAKVKARCRAVAELVQRMALRIARKKRPEVEQISEREVRKQVAREVGEIVDEQLERANRVINEQFLDPLDAASIRPKISARTSASSLAMSTTIATAGQLAATRPPSHPEDRDAAARLKIHESFANNVSVLCEGMPLDPADYRSTLGDMFGMELKLDEPDAFGFMQMVQFAKQNPVEVRFRDELVWVTLRFEAFSDGEETYEGGPWQASTAYRLSIEGSQIALQRVQPVEIVAEEEIAQPLTQVVSGILFQHAATTEYAAVGQAIHRLKLRFSSVQVGNEWMLVELRRQGTPPAAEDAVVSNALGEGR